MLIYVLRKLLSVALLLVLVFTGAFFLMRLAPGGPFDAERALPPAIEKSIAARFQLDQPLLVQYGSYLADVFLRGDLRPSFSYRDTSVNQIIAETLPRSAALGAAALLLALLLGVPAGLLAAARRGRARDLALSALFALGLAVPNFVLATVLVLLFSFVLRWCPVAGFSSLRHLGLPSRALGVPLAAGVLEALGSPYIRTARAKGLTPRAVLARHALRAGLVPVVTYLGPAAAAILTGSLVVEKIFAIPGMGSFFVTSVMNRDYTLAMGVLLLYFGLLALLNALVDISLHLIDPRVELR
ncbi:MAG: ABC transporter permease subunit [Planctomycetes bacterium]|nr:ABC transporter permease subunit [Planctomycetota bacterium]